MKFSSVCLLLALVLTGCGTGNRSSQVLAAAKSAHVVLVIEENHSFGSVYPNAMPWLSALGNANGIATNYWSNQAGSLLAYLWLSSGSSAQAFGCTGGGCTEPITDDNIFRELNNAGLSWKLYADALPAAGFMGAASGYYVKRHNPAAWYSDMINSPAQQMHIVPSSELVADLASNNLPNYSIIVPDLMNDAHTGTLATADNWLQTYIAPLLSSPYFQPGGDGVMFITFDNADGDAQGQVFAAVVGPRVIPGVKVNTPFRHENTLRTMMDLLGLQAFSSIAQVAPMNEFFR